LPGSPIDHRVALEAPHERGMGTVWKARDLVTQQPVAVMRTAALCGLLTACGSSGVRGGPDHWYRHVHDFGCPHAGRLRWRNKRNEGHDRTPLLAHASSEVTHAHTLRADLG
jgi:hypothetical protein